MPCAPFFPFCAVFPCPACRRRSVTIRNGRVLDRHRRHGSTRLDWFRSQEMVLSAGRMIPSFAGGKEGGKGVGREEVARRVAGRGSVGRGRLRGSALSRGPHPGGGRRGARARGPR